MRAMEEVTITGYAKFVLIKKNAGNTDSILYHRYKCINYAEINKGLLPFKEYKNRPYVNRIDCQSDCNEYTDDFFYHFTTGVEIPFDAKFIEHDQDSEIYYFYFDFYQDAYLQITNSDCTEIEIIVFSGCKGLMGTIYPMFTYGFYDKELNKLTNK